MVVDEECSCCFVTGGSTAYAAWNGSALPIIHMLRVYLAVERTSGLPAVLCGLFARTPLRSLAARSIDARYATSKILANSSRRPKFNRIAFRAWLTSNQPEICLFEITFTACTRTRALTYARLGLSLDGTVSTNRAEEAARRSFFHHPFSFLFFSLSFNSNALRTENEKGIITSNCTRKLYGSLERKRNEEEKWGEGEKPSYLRADILERRGVEWGREKRAKRKKNRAKRGWWRLTVESAANCGEKGKSWPGWVTFFRVEVADFCFHSINPPLPRG